MKVKVGNVPGLVKKLGGASLYGDNVLVPLRELIQNAGDSVRARRVFEEKSIDFGKIDVDFSETDGKEIIKISDVGIGMSRDVLVGPFLDFGESYWGGSLMQREHPGLSRKGFQAVGGFGIGFYSVFMWGDNVKVITRSRSSGPSETLVLHFQEGLTGRPVLRIAETAEQLQESGATICVELKHTNFEEILSGITYQGNDLFFQQPAKSPKLLNAICAWLCPISDTEIRSIQKQEKILVAVQANDWVTIDAVALLKRICSELGNQNILTMKIGDRLRPLIQDGITIARLGICLDLMPKETRYHRNDFPTSIITAGLLRADTSFSGIAGVSMGVPSTASRLSATTSLRPETLRNWANEQRDLLEIPLLSAELQINIANIIRNYGGDTGALLIAENYSGYLSFDDIVSKLDWPDEIILVQDAHWHIEKHKKTKLKLRKNVIAVDSGRREINDSLATAHQEKTNNIEFWNFHQATMLGAVVEALSLAWKISLNEIIANMAASTDDHSVCADWAELPNGKKLNYDHLTILRKPK